MNSPSAVVTDQPLDSLMRAPLYMAPETPLRAALATMSRQRATAVVAISDGRPCGLFTERDAVSLCLQTDVAEHLLGEACGHRPLIVEIGVSLIEGYRRMLAADERHLLLVDADGILQGIVEEKDLVGHFGIEHFAHLDSVSRLMTCNVVTLRPFSTMRQAARALGKHGIGSVVIEDDARPVGIVTLTDLTRTLAERDDLDAIRLEQVMSRDLVTVETEESVFSAAQQMRRADVRHIVVTCEGQTAGVLTEHDVLKTMESRHADVLRRIISDQAREIEAQRRELHERDLLDQLLSRNQGLGLVLCGQDGIVAYVNQAALALLGVDAAGDGRFDTLLSAVAPVHRQTLAGLVGAPPPGEQWLRVTRGGMDIGVRAIGVERAPFDGQGRALLLILNDETLARHTEEILEFNHQAVRDIPHMVIWIDSEGVIVHANNAVHEAMGFGPGQLLGRPVKALAPHCEDRRLEERLLQMHGKRSRYFRCELSTKSGEIVPVEVFGSHLALHGKDFYCGFIRDLTEQQVVERALRSSQNQLLALLQASPDFIVVKDGDNRWQVANQSGLAMIGLTGFDYADKDDRELAALCEPAYADCVVRLARSCDQAWQENRPLRALHTLPHPDGGERYLDMIEVPVVDEADEHRAMVVIGRDVTERVRAEQERDLSVERLRAAVAAMDDLMLVLDDRHHVVAHYPREGDALRLHASGALLGQAIADVLPPQVAALYQDASVRLARTGRPQGFDYALADASGDEHWFGARLTAQSPENACPPGFTLLVRDISDRKQAEAHIQELNESLEERVAARTSEMRAAMAELESFSYSISHDLRTPLRAIEGFGRLLEIEYGDRLDDTACDYLTRIRHAAQRMANLIDDLLDLARVSRKSLQKQTVDLSRLASEIVAELEERQPGRVVTVSIADGLEARADPMLIRVVLENLLGNAWKFTERCRPGAHIEVGSMRQDGRDWFFVRDDGAGFDMAYADRLFKPFQRLHSQSEFEGTGIGLATIHRIVSRHDGKVAAEGEPGRGACFRFSLGD